MLKDRKDSVSINTCVGEELFNVLELFCAITGQSKTVAVERAIEAYCSNDSNHYDIDEALLVDKQQR